MDDTMVKDYLEKGWEKSSLVKIDEIIKIVNKLPIQHKKQREELFQFMLAEELTENPDEKWTPAEPEEKKE